MAKKRKSKGNTSRQAAADSKSNAGHASSDVTISAERPHSTGSSKSKTTDVAKFDYSADSTPAPRRKTLLLISIALIGLWMAMLITLSILVRNA